MTTPAGRARAKLAMLLSASVLVMATGARADDVASTCADAANAGQPLRRAGRLREARAQFLLCARDECPDSIRNRCGPWVSEVDAAMPSIVIRARGGRGADIVGLRVEIDGVAVTNPSGVAILLDPGAHRVRYQGPGGEAREDDVVVAQGEKNRVLLVTFPEVAPDEPPIADVAPRKALVAPALAYGVGAIGVVALGAFALFEVKAHNGYADLENGCSKSRSCSPSDLDAVRRDGTVAVVAGGLGVAALAASVFLLLWRSPVQTRPAARARAVTGGSITELSGRF